MSAVRWTTTARNGDRFRRIHVIPVDDLKPHIESSDCQCDPIEKVEAEGIIYVHNAFDGRELVEQHGVN